MKLDLLDIETQYINKSLYGFPIDEGMPVEALL